MFRHTVVDCISCYPERFAVGILGVKRPVWAIRASGTSDLVLTYMVEIERIGSCRMIPVAAWLKNAPLSMMPSGRIWTR